MDLSLLQSTPTWLAALIILLSLLYYYLTSSFGFLEKQGVKTEKPWPIIGSINIRRPMNMKDFDADLYKKFGRFYGYYEGSKPVIHIADPDLIKQVCVKDFWAFPYSREMNFGNDAVMNNFLPALRGEKWKMMRSVMSPCFTTGKLKVMTDIIEECCKTLIENLNKVAESGEPIEIKKIISSYTLEVIALCAFGTKINSMAEPDNAFLVHSRKLFNSNFNWRIFIAFFLPKLSKYLPTNLTPNLNSPFKFFQEMANSVIDMRKKEKESPRDFLALMLEAEIDENSEQQTANGEATTKEHTTNKKKVLNRDLIVAQSVLFLIAGNENTATPLAISLYLLAKNPDVQEKLAEEVAKVTSEHEQLDYQAVAAMTYLDMVVNETLRIFPAAVRTERTCTEDGYELGGVTLKKGMLVGMPVYSIHHDPEYYPDPEKFDPERFSAENKANRNPFVYLPFGAGPRNCIAMRFALMEIKMTLAAIIKEFVVKTCPQTEETLEFFVGAGGMIPKSVTLTLENRLKK